MSWLWQQHHHPSTSNLPLYLDTTGFPPKKTISILLVTKKIIKNVWVLVDDDLTVSIHSSWWYIFPRYISKKRPHPMQPWAALCPLNFITRLQLQQDYHHTEASLYRWFKILLHSQKQSNFTLLLGYLLWSPVVAGSDSQKSK